MIEKLTKVTVLALSMVLVSLTLVACGGGAPSNSNAESGQDTPAAEGSGEGAGATKEGLPASFSAYDNAYSITDFEITKGEDGNTVIACKGSGFDVLPFRNGSMSIPVWCSVIEGETETEFISASMDGEGVEFIFDRVLDPDTVVFYPGDKPDERTEIVVK